MQKMKVVLGFMLTVLLLVFAAQNTQTVSVYFFIVESKNIPLFLVIILSAILGFAAGYLAFWTKITLRNKNNG